MSETRLPRALRPGRSVGRTLYDAETNQLVGVMDTPELARWVCATIWRESRSHALADGVTAVAPDICAMLDELIEQPVPPSTDAEDPRLNADTAYEVVAGTEPSPPREQTPAELVDQLTWEMRRLAEAQYEVGMTLGRLHARSL